MTIDSAIPIAIAVALIAIVGGALFVRRARNAPATSSSNGANAPPAAGPAAPDTSDATIVARMPIASDATIVAPMGLSDATVVDLRVVPAPAPIPAGSVAAAASSAATRTLVVAPVAASPESVEGTASTVVIVAPPRPHARLVLKAGGGGPWELTQREYAIGRSSSSDVILADASVSGHHAKLVPVGDDFAIRDLGSRNGTEVDGVPLMGERPLRGGETILLGECALLYERT